MEILVSLFNTKATTPNLWIFDSNLKPLFSFAEGFKDIKGLEVDQDSIYAGHRDENDNCWLLIFSKNTRSLVKKVQLLQTRRVHSIKIRGNDVFVVSSGTNQVLVYDLKVVKKTKTGIKPRKIISTHLTNISTQDKVHLNSIAFDNNDNLCVSGFGTKNESERWLTAKSGFILNTAKRAFVAKKLYHPHSLLFLQDNYWICASGEKRVYRNNQAVINKAVGFTRGLFVDKKEDYLFLGTSTSRVYSDMVVDSNTSGIHKYIKRESNFLLASSHFFNDEYAEVYDIVRL